MEFSTCPGDESLGPAVKGCRGDFDFTIKFEKVFSLVPASVFIAICLARVVYLTRQPIVVRASLLKWLKLAAISAYASLQLSLLTLSSTKARKLEAFFILSHVLGLASSLLTLALSALEHSRSPRPSIFLNGYLFITIFMEIAETRTLWLASRNSYEILYSRLFTSAIAVKALIVILESKNKTRWVIMWDIKEHSPEETSGLFGLGAFFWLNRLFLTGYTKILSLDDLFPLDQNMASETLSARLAGRLGSSHLSGRKNGLAKAVAQGLAVPLLLPIAPRVALMAFSFCQPFLINTLLGYLAKSPEVSSPNNGYGLMGATVLVYTGIAASNAFYWYFQERAMYMVRGVLASAVYKKTTEVKISTADNSAALTLMSVDVERVIRGFLRVQEVWANAIQVSLACWLLSRQIGVASVAPVIVVGCCMVSTTIISKKTGPRQKAWMEKIQKRVGLTSNVIGQMKQIKISGLAGPVEESIQAMRLDELKVGNRFRKVLVFSSVTGFTPLCLSPLMTFAFAGRALDVITIFTSVSYILLLSSPLSSLFQDIPNILASFTCLDRIQKFLESDPRVDFRETTISDCSSRSPAEGGIGGNGAPHGIKISGGNYGWQNGKPSLTDINIDIPAARLTVVVGPVASGKSTLCKALLGESPLAQGQITMGPASIRKIGYCDQSPFLSNTTIRENIIGFSAFDQARYDEIIDATLLQQDLSLLPRGDHTVIGSKGITLSGGQKQRVSMARALYLDSNFFIFDDILSGLDADTEEQVFRRVFSADTGLLRRRNATVILCTHSVRHLPSADHIVALGPDGTIVEQGTFQELVANQQYVHGLNVDSQGINSVLSGESKASENTSSHKPDSDTRVASQKPVGCSQDANRMTGDLAVYRHYLTRISRMSIVGFVVFGLGWGFFGNFSTIWLKFWTEDITSTEPKHSNAFYLGLYAVFQLSTLLSLFFMCLLCFTSMIMLSGSRLHKETLQTVINAPLKFFTTTDTGVVTNLFAQDMTLIDGELPLAIVNVVLIIFGVAGTAAVIATASPYLTIAYPFLVAMLYFIQKFYLRTSRQIRLLDLEAKSPLYAHFIDTIQGIATFRAFGWVESGIELNNKLLDTSQRPAYLLAMIQRWLAFILQLVVAVLAFVVVTLATHTHSNTGFTGASLVALMSFGQSLSLIIIFYTSLETSIGAVSRLKTFNETVKPEGLEGEDVIPPREWPFKGGIHIKSVSASYGISNANPESGTDGSENLTAPALNSEQLALNNLNLEIAPGEKIALCGRSGRYVSAQWV